MSASLIVAAVGFAMIALIDQKSGVVDLIGGLLVSSLAITIAAISAIHLMLDSIEPERAGEASATAETGAALGGALGIALLGAVGVACYQSTLANIIPPGLTEQQTQAAIETLGGALAVAQQLSPRAGNLLTDTARVAFDSSLHVAAILSAATLAALSVGLTITAYIQKNRIGRRS